MPHKFYSPSFSPTRFLFLLRNSRIVIPRKNIPLMEMTSGNNPFLLLSRHFCVNKAKRVKTHLKSTQQQQQEQIQQFFIVI